ncbi:MAG: dihydropteridine reductase [Clostridia bacterium]|nr:dihydropteridine reductase [Clostridia bacterium]
MNTDKIYAEYIANKYSEKETTKVKQLRKLDSRAKRTGKIWGYTFGVCSSLVFGTGMCLSMGVIGSGVIAMTVGIIIGCLGIFGCGVNYPIYRKLIQKGKMKYGSDIIRLANEISDEM